MKRILTLALAALALAVSCQKQQDAATPKAEFATNLYTVPTLGTVDLVVKLDKAAPAALSIPVSFGGTAVKGTDFSVSAESVAVAAGATSGQITVTDLGLAQDKTITATLGAGSGYALGTKYLATVTPAPLEVLIYSFKEAKTELVESATVTITITGQTSGASYKATEDLNIPVKVTGDNADAVVLSADHFTVAKGQNQATLTLTPDPEKTEELSSDVKVKVEVDRASASRTLIPGDNEFETVKVHSGIQVPSRLVGVWEFNRVYALEEVEEWFFLEDDDPDELPTHNQGFTLTFTEDEETGVVTLTPGTAGDFQAFFRTCTVTLTTPKNYTAEGELMGQYTVKELNMFMGYDPEGYEEPVIFTYYKLSSANRLFDKTTQQLGESVIAFRLNEEGGLEMMFRDYDTPPFGLNWWSDEKFDPDMFGFASLFTKKTN